MDKEETNIAWIEMDVYLFRDDENGRKEWISYGYRPSVCFDGACYESIWSLIDRVRIYPGEAATVRALLTSRDLHMSWDTLKGKEFEVREGPRTIGKGKISSIIETDVYQYRAV